MHLKLIYILFTISAHDVMRDKINNFKSKILSSNKNRKNDDYFE